MLATLLHFFGITTRAEVQALREDLAAVWRDRAPVGALPLYMCPVCHQCLTAAAFRAHLPGNQPPGAADYHRRHGLNMQDGHLQGGFLDYQTGEFRLPPGWYSEQADIVEPFPAPTSPQDAPEPEAGSVLASGRQRGTAGLSFPGRGTE